MRIISGQFRGRKLIAREGEFTRPTLDRVKEAVFNMIQWDIENSYFLDLFSGSGAIGIEAISRGAAFTVFCDNDTESIKVIEKNLAVIKPQKEKYLVITSDYKSALNRLTKYRFQLVYIDPPYKEKEIYDKILDDVYNVVKENGKVVIEHNEIKDFSHPDYEIISTKKYGAVYLTVLSKTKA